MSLKCYWVCVYTYCKCIVDFVQFVAPIFAIQGWKPPFAVDVETFTFTPRIQPLNELEVNLVVIIVVDLVFSVFVYILCAVVTVLLNIAYSVL